MVREYLVGWERIQHAILRYQKGDTLQYLFDNLLINMTDYPPEIRFLYVLYMPGKQSGVFGVHVDENVLPSSEIQDYKEITSNGVNYIPLYHYQICDSVVRFHKMTQKERITDTRHISSAVYAKGEWLKLKSYLISVLVPEFMPEVQMIFEKFYDVQYRFLIRSDTIENILYSENCPANIPMFYLPLDTNIYYKKNMRNYLVAKRLGFCSSSEYPEDNKLADYRHEIDTALLALPIRIFQEKYLQTEDIYCLDELNIYYKQK
jgi:hypothetical protein